MTNPYELEFSCDGGKTWEVIGALDPESVRDLGPFSAAPEGVDPIENDLEFPSGPFSIVECNLQLAAYHRWPVEPACIVGPRSPDRKPWKKRKKGRSWTPY